jgi:cytochrome P450
MDTCWGNKKTGYRSYVMQSPSTNSCQPNIKTAAPGPRGQFLFGSIQDFQQDQLGFVLRMAREYGPVARYRLGSIILNQVNHPDGVQRILQENQHNYIKGSYFDPIRQVGGDGLFASEGAHWLRQRRLMQPAFHRQRVAGFAEVMTGQTVHMLGRWEAAAQSRQPIDISHEFTDLTMRVIAETMFSTHLEEDVRAVGDAITLLLEDMNFRFQVPFYPKFGFPTRRNLRAQKALKVIDAVIYRIIGERRRSSSQENDLLDMLMNARDEETGEVMSDKHLRDEVVTIFVAGHETTAVLLTWLLHILGREDEWENRLASECIQVLNGRLPGFADLGQLPNLRMAIDETLRLYPPAWITNRTAVKDDEICGYPIRAGEVVAVAPYVVHRLEEYWPDPECFDPSRFSPENSTGRPRFAYFPFGGGSHQCIGRDFALVEAQLIFATLVQLFRLRAVPERPVVIEPTATLRPKGGVWMRIQKREALTSEG